MERFEIVRSKAGHDQGDVFLVSEIVNKEYVLLVDGKNRLLSKPKKKKIKHVESLNIVERELESIFDNKTKMNDGELRKILKKY